MKLAINHTRFASTGGVERYLYNLVLRLLAEGHEVHYYCYKWEDFSHPRLFFHRVPYLKGIRSLKILSFAYFSQRRLQKASFDLILGFGKTYFQDIYRDGTGCLRDYQEYSLSCIPNPIRRWFRKVSPYQQAILAIEGYRFQPGHFKKIIANSEWVRKQILERYHLDPDQVEVVYSGADCERFDPRNRLLFGQKIRKQFGIDEKDFVVLFVGNDFRRKGLDTIFKAAVRLRSNSPRLRILVVGRDRRERTFKKLASELGLGGTVIFAGHQPETFRFYGAADCFALPSRFDPFPNAVLEAMASGLPVIVTRKSGACETLDGSGFILEDPESDLELAEKITALTDESRRARMAAEARKMAESLTWETHLEKVLAICERVVQTPAEGRSGMARDPDRGF